MKKIVFLLSVIILGGLLLACNNDEPGEKELIDLSNPTNVYAMSAVSSVGLINDDVAPLKLSSFINESLVEEDIVNHLDYIYSLLNREYGVLIETHDESDLEEYEVFQTISLNGLNSTSTLYKFYYNVKYEEIDEDDDEIEITTYIEGIIIKDDEVYKVAGKNEVEIEDDEEEFKTEFKISKNDSNYVVVKYEEELEVDNGNEELEKKFTHIVYEDGKKVSETSFDFELEDGEIEVELEIKVGNIESEYKLYSTSDVNKIKVKYEIENDDYENEEEGEFYIIVETDNLGNYHYFFEGLDKNQDF